jgi:hypothetical protein
VFASSVLSDFLLVLSWQVEELLSGQGSREAIVPEQPVSQIELLAGG